MPCAPSEAAVNRHTPACDECEMRALQALAKLAAIARARRPLPEETREASDACCKAAKCRRKRAAGAL